MLGIVALVGMFAYGRMFKSFGYRPWLIALILGVVLTYASALMLGVQFDNNLIVPGLVQSALFAAVYVIGVVLGRWLDRHKELD